MDYTKHILSQLPRTTQRNEERFGLMIMVDSEAGWTVSYYTHYSNKLDDRIPLIKGKTIEAALNNMLVWFEENMPNALIKI